MLRASADSLDRTPHVFVGGQQIPSRLPEVFPVDPAALIDSLGRSLLTIGQHLSPNQIAVALDGYMRVSVLQNLFRVQRRVDASVNDPSPSFAGDTADFIAAQRVARVNADADYIARLHIIWIQVLQRFVAKYGIPIFRGRSRCDDKHPTGSNDGGPEGCVAWINDVYFHYYGSARPRRRQAGSAYVPQPG